MIYAVSGREPRAENILLYGYRRRNSRGGCGKRLSSGVFCRDGAVKYSLDRKAKGCFIASWSQITMATPLSEYKKFITDLVKRQPSVIARAIRENGHLYPLERNQELNHLLAQLSSEQREIIAQLVQRSRDGGIHDTLVYLADEINLGGLRLSRNGMELAIEPYGTEMYFDWVARLAGDDWPEHQLEVQYREADTATV